MKDDIVLFVKTEQKMINNNKKVFKTAVVVFLSALLLGSALLLVCNVAVKQVGGRNMITVEQAGELEDVDCIIVLGCRVFGSGAPSNMLAARLDTGILLYDCGVAPKLLMSGDHGQREYDEVNAMKKYAVANDVESSDVFMDHAGFSTYESIFRAKEIFGIDKAVIVTQEYHLYRALYIAEKLGIEAYGVATAPEEYGGEFYRSCREVLARTKDCFSCIFLPEPTYLGDSIPISGDGNVTDD